MIPCFDIGATEIKAALADRAGALTILGRCPTPRDDLAAFAEAIAGFLQLGATPADHPASIAIAGIVDTASGRLTCANIPCVDGVNVGATLGERLGRRVLVLNDADAFAVAQALLGVGRGKRVVFGAILGSGVGGGLVVDGRLVRGESGYAGEWGHGPVVATEAGEPPVHLPRFPCGCGLRGCVDTIGGARGLERLHAHLHGRTLSSHEIIGAWQNQVQAACSTIEIWGDLVANPLALVVNVVGADVVPVGGGLGNVPRLIEALDRAVRGRILRDSEPGLVTVGTSLAEPGLVGAALLAATG